MFRMDKWFLGGWLYFFAARALSFVLPEWTGKENGIIENLQLLWLVGGMAYCWHMRSSKQPSLLCPLFCKRKSCRIPISYTR